MKGLIAALPFLAATAGAVTGFGGAFVFSHPLVPRPPVDAQARPLPPPAMPAPELRESSPLPVAPADPAPADEDVEVGGCGGE